MSVVPSYSFIQGYLNLSGNEQDNILGVNGVLKMKLIEPLVF